MMAVVLSSVPSSALAWLRVGLELLYMRGRVEVMMADRMVVRDICSCVDNTPFSQMNWSNPLDLICLFCLLK